MPDEPNTDRDALQEAQDALAVAKERVRAMLQRDRTVQHLRAVGVSDGAVKEYEGLMGSRIDRLDDEQDPGTEGPRR